MDQWREDGEGEAVKLVDFAQVWRGWEPLCFVHDPFLVWNCQAQKLDFDEGVSFIEKFVSEKAGRWRVMSRCLDVSDEHRSDWRSDEAERGLGPDDCENFVVSSLAVYGTDQDFASPRRVHVWCKHLQSSLVPSIWSFWRQKTQWASKQKMQELFGLGKFGDAFWCFELNPVLSRKHLMFTFFDMQLNNVPGARHVSVESKGRSVANPLFKGLEEAAVPQWIVWGLVPTEFLKPSMILYDEKVVRLKMPVCSCLANYSYPVVLLGKTARCVPFKAVCPNQ